MLTQPITATTTTTAATSRIANVSHALIRTANGEITASSAEANPALAAGLIKLKDGNYSYPIVSASDRAGGVDALNALKLGG